MYVCLCVCVCVLTRMYMHIQEFKPKQDYCFSLLCFALLPWDQKVAFSLGWPTSNLLGSACLHPQGWHFRCRQPCPTFYVGAGNPNPSRSQCSQGKQAPEPTELTPAPGFVLLLLCLDSGVWCVVSCASSCISIMSCIRPGDPDLGNGDPDRQAQKLLILLPLPPTPIFSFSVDLYTWWFPHSCLNLEFMETKKWSFAKGVIASAFSLGL